MRAEVTVVIPTRNRLAYVREAVASVQAQTFTNLEAIVIDDCSDDGTPAWLDTLTDERVRAVRLEHHGERSAARNRGLAEASGRFVLFLDDDDRLTTDALEKLTGALRDRPGVPAAIGAMVEFDDAGNRRRERHPRRTSERWAWPDALFAWKGNPGRVLYRTDVVRDVGGFATGLHVGEDLDLWLRVARRGPVVFVPDVVLEARLHPGQTVITDGRASFAGVTSRHVEGLPDGQRSAAQRVEDMRRTYEAALDALDEHRAAAAVRHVIGCVREDPRLVLSPIIRPRLMRAFGKAVIGVVTGPGGLRSARGLAARVRRLTRTDAWRAKDGEDAR
jgi:glycosyltransferase involved in cell wall biosynthesis